MSKPMSFACYACLLAACLLMAFEYPPDYSFKALLAANGCCIFGQMIPNRKEAR